MKRLLALVLVLAMAVTCCVTASAEENNNADLYPGTTEENTIVVDLSMEPTSINSLSGTYSADFKIMNCLLTGLCAHDENSNPGPGVAESWDIAEDGLTYTFHLRDDVVWSNGTQVTANDYAFAWKMAMTAETGTEYAYFLYNTAAILNGEKFYNGECDWEEVGVKVLDDYTLEVKLAAPIPYFLSLMTFGTLFPVNEAFYNEVGADNYFMDPEYTISCGPYVMDTWTHDSEIILKKNPTYFDADKVSVDTFVWKMYTTSDTRLNAFKAGEVDVISLTGDQAVQMKNEGFVTHDFVEQTEYHILFNCEDKYMSNKNLRKAIDACYSRSAYIAAILKDQSQPATMFCPGPVAGFDGNSFRDAMVAEIGELRSAEADEAAAKDYLAKALEELGCTVEDLSAHITMNVGDSDTAVNTAAFFQENIRTVLGIDITVNSMTTKALSAERNNGNFVLDFSGWGGDYNDPMTWYDMWETGGGNNSVKFSNADYDAALADARTNTDLEARQKDFYTCEQILAEECPISTVYYRSSSYAISGKVTGGYILDTWQNNFRFATVK
ncbi:MAG: peptide ABC transporter substrate-binding protein [Clostridia bacterium]|nr:peptide ABC transporter substrate-binding protein [Clostridia bacterium]